MSVLTPGIRSHLFGAVGVLAVCGLATTGVAYIHIRQQNKTIETQSDRIGDLVKTNKSWATWAAQQQKIRAIEQQNTEALQNQIALIENHSADMAQRIKELEASNAQIKEYMSRPVPLELKRLLQQK